LKDRDGDIWMGVELERKREKAHMYRYVRSKSYVYMYVCTYAHNTSSPYVSYAYIHTYTCVQHPRNQFATHFHPLYHLLLLHSATPCVCVCTYVMHIKYICMDVWMYVCTNCEKHSKIKEKPTDIRVKLTEKQKRWSIKQGKPPKKKRKNKKKNKEKGT